MKASTPPKLSFSAKTRKYLTEYGRSSTMHGMYYLTEERSRTEKLFWIIIMSFCLTGCVYMILEIWKKYETSPIVITIAPRERLLNEIPFPAVTICPEAKCSKSKFNYSGVLYDILNRNQVSDKDYKAFQYIHLLCEKEDEEDPITTAKDRIIGNDFFRILDEVQLDFHANCSFLGNYTSCEEFFIPVITDQGICYSFNILGRSAIFRNNVAHFKNFWKISQNSSFFDGVANYLEGAPEKAYPYRPFLSGADNALEIFFTQNSSNTECECNTYVQGFRVLIHTPLEVPQLNKHYFRLSYDKAVMVAVQPHLLLTTEKVKNFNPEKRRCYLQNERHLAYFRTYSQKNCFLECITNYTLNHCKCVNFFMPRENGTSICSGNRLACLDEAEQKMKSYIISGKQKKCDCKPSCTVLRYDTEATQSDFYWQGYVQNIGKIVEYDETRHSFLSIYLKNSNFMTVERKEMYGISDFISNFGGLLSLFMGFSLISVYECIYFMTLRIICNKRLYKNWAGSMC